MRSETQRKSLAALFRFLSEKWPAAFSQKTPKPLKIGIREDIRAIDGELSDEELNRALRAYSRRDEYLSALRAGAERVDLNGNHAGEVSEAEASTAQAWLRARSGARKVSQLAEPKAVAQPPSKPVPNRTLSNKAGISANRPVGIVVEKKRRRVIKPAR